MVLLQNRTPHTVEVWLWERDDGAPVQSTLGPHAERTLRRLYAVEVRAPNLVPRRRIGKRVRLRYVDRVIFTEHGTNLRMTVRHRQLSTAPTFVITGVILLAAAAALALALRRR